MRHMMLSVRIMATDPPIEIEVVGEGVHGGGSNYLIEVPIIGVFCCKLFKEQLF